MKKKIKILVADDEKDLVEIYTYNLEKEGYSVYAAYDGKEAYDMALEIQPKMILLDVMMPKYNGLQICKELRNLPEFKETYILIVTASDDDQKQIEGLENGADDYIVKPINHKVLKSKIKSFLRRDKDLKATEKITIKDLEINPKEYTVLVKKRKHILTKKEFFILYELASNPDQVFTREDIIAKVWGKDVFVGIRTIDVHIRKIREKLDYDCLTSLKGIGYKFNT